MTSLCLTSPELVIPTELMTSSAHDVSQSIDGTRPFNEGNGPNYHETFISLEDK